MSVSTIGKTKAKNVLRIGHLMCLNVCCERLGGYLRQGGVKRKGTSWKPQGYNEYYLQTHRALRKRVLAPKIDAMRMVDQY